MLTYAVTWMDLEHIILSKRNQTQKITQYVEFYLYVMPRKLYRPKVAPGCLELERSQGEVGTRINGNQA